MVKMNVLIIDDNSLNIFALKAILLTNGYGCIPFYDAEAALAVLEGDTPVDIILIDMMMPGMDGYAAIPLIRKIEKRKGTPIIAVTAQAMQGDKEKCLLAGAHDYISKPINVDRLVSILEYYKEQIV